MAVAGFPIVWTPSSKAHAMALAIGVQGFIDELTAVICVAPASEREGAHAPGGLHHLPVPGLFPKWGSILRFARVRLGHATQWLRLPPLGWLSRTPGCFLHSEVPDQPEQTPAGHSSI